MVPLLLALQLSAAPSDRTREAEASEMALKERIRDQERVAAMRADMRRQAFEQHFNKLVDAVAEFAKEYNHGKGQVWPRPQAEKLRRAMMELQTLDGGLGGRRDHIPACATPIIR